MKQSNWWSNFFHLILFMALSIHSQKSYHKRFFSNVLSLLSDPTTIFKKFIWISSMTLSWFWPKKKKFLFAINLTIIPLKKFYSLNTTDVFTALYQMDYQSKLKGVEEFKKSKLPAVWQFVCHFVIRCLSGRTGGTDNMGKQLLDIVWSVYTGNAVNYGQIIWDDFLQYISKDAPKEGMIELTFARFWSLCLVDLHKDAKLSMGSDTNLFSACDLKMYNPSKD